LSDSGKKVVLIWLRKRIGSPELRKMKEEKKEKLYTEKTI